MNLLKSLYISSYVTFISVGSLYGLYRLRSEGLDLAWAGFVATTLPFALMLARAYAFHKIARTSARLGPYMLTTLVGVGLAAYGVAMQGADPVALALAGAGGLAFGIYNFWYSRLGRESSQAIEVGRVLADFELSEGKGSTLKLSELEGKSLLILFFRGNWCPLCMAQIKEVAASYRALAERGVEILLVSPQPVSHSERLAKQFDVPMRFLTDSGNQMATALGIAHASGVPQGLQVLGYESETVLPTVIITDAERRVIWRHETDNYRVRPEPETFLAVLDGHAPA